MGKFMNGMLVGLGAGLLFAPMTGEDMRRRIGEQWQNLQHSLASNGFHIPSDPSVPLSRREQPTPLASSQITNVGQQAELNAMKTRPNIEEDMPRRPSPSTRRESQGRTPTP